jgi:hypothetical protein
MNEVRLVPKAAGRVLHPLALALIDSLLALVMR